MSRHYQKDYMTIIGNSTRIARGPEVDLRCMLSLTH